MLAHLASPSFGSSSPGEAGDRGVSKDMFAAEIIQSLADEGSPFARELISDSRVLLGAASVHAARAARVRKGAMRASRMGYHGLCRMGMDAARAEEGRATAYAAQVAGAVRRSHAGVFGYLTPEEERQRSRDLFLEGLSASQREVALDSLLDRVTRTSINYGIDDADAVEVDDEALGEIQTALSCYGADADVVFGEGVFKKIGESIRPAITKLQKRMEAVEKRLAKLEGRGAPDEVVEETRKKKARVKKKLDEAEEVAEASEAAEEKSDEMGGMEAAALFDDPRADFAGHDEALMLAADHFGLSEQRRDKIEARVAKIQKKIEELEDKGGNEKKISMLKARVVKLQSKLEDAEEGKASEDSLPDSLVTKQPKAYSQDEFVQSFFGGDGTSRRAFVGYFTRRAEAMGVAVPDMHASFGAVQAEESRRNISEFFEDVALRAQSMVDPNVRASLKAARDEARRAFSVESRLAALRVARRDYMDALERSRDYVRKVGRSLRGRGAAPTLGPQPGDYLNMPGGYSYRLAADGRISILRAPKGRKTGSVSPTSKAGKAILAEMSQYPDNRVDTGRVGKVIPGTYANMPGGYAYSVDENLQISIVGAPGDAGVGKVVSPDSGAGRAILAQISQFPQNRVA